MKKQSRHFLTFTSVLIIGCILFTGCGSTTLIKSVPEGAKVYVDGEPVGVTPYEHYDTKIVGSKTEIRLIMDGFEDLNTWIIRDEDIDVGALIGGILFPPIPFLWIMKYKPQHTFDMVPWGENVQEVYGVEEISVSGDAMTNSKSERLYKIKDLLDKKILTQEEFDVEKKKILAE